MKITIETESGIKMNIELSDEKAVSLDLETQKNFQAAESLFKAWKDHFTTRENDPGEEGSRFNTPEEG